MNKIVLAAALRLLPYKIQTKAISKALNFLLLPAHTKPLTDKYLSIGLTDPNKQWLFIKSSAGFEGVALRDNIDMANTVSINVALATVIASRDKNCLTNAIKSRDIAVDGSTESTMALYRAIDAIKQSQLDSLSRHFFAFLKMKDTTPPRLNLETVTLMDVKTSADVDFLRDEAIRLEATDLNMAYKLMELAHNARPSGPLIKEKLEEYRIKLQ
ncbi:hypothetical protein [Shewanella youngdeokensis]|uniref:SCP2 domain-containing protein n=1 Tax=Shewanella youngdeokensis TaxID=2999068 RepID=A0ABZ0K388_9GAMM|nr:hypothetical protein RGE70_05760 [Shewanella sp. DAU334]